jgi:YhhN-like protein
VKNRVSWKQNNTTSIILFLTVETLLYAHFLYFDLTKSIPDNISNRLKFVSIWICFIFTFVKMRKKYDAFDLRILRAALFFTVLSDLSLLLLKNYVPGLIFFSVVQALYLLRLYRWKYKEGLIKERKPVIFYYMRNILVTTLLLIFLFFIVNIEFLIILATFYFVSICFNVADSIYIAYRSKKRQRKIFAIGMTLFLMCDIQVGLFNMHQFIQVSGLWYETIYSFATVGMWLFYLPSQVAISLSKYSN